MSSDGGELLTIGQLAARSGRTASSIRYYESIGLLPEPLRVGGRRRYPAATVRTLAVLDTAQRAGLTLEEITSLLHASPDTVHELRAIAERKLPEIEATIERATIVRDWLECAARCECPSLDDCVLFDETCTLPPVHPAARWARGA